MSAGRRPFDPGELRGASGASFTEAELASLGRVAREIDDLASDPPAPTVDFTDRVIAAVMAEPMPTRFRLSGVGILATIGGAWRVATSGAMPAMVRAQGLAIVLVAVVGTGALGALGLVAAGRLLDTDGPSPTPVLSPGPTFAPTPGPSTSPVPTASPTPTPDESVSPSPASSATPSPTPTDDPQEDETPEPTQDDESDPGSGNSGPGSGNSGPGSDDSGGADDSGPDSDDSGSDGSGGSASGSGSGSGSDED